MITYPVVEKFVSINGEGQKAGEIAAFIRYFLGQYKRLPL